MSDEQFLQVRFSGNDLKPSDVHANDLADIIRAWSALITESTKQRSSAAVADDLRVSVVSVQPGSLILLADTSYPSYAHDAYSQALGLAQAQRYELLSHGEREQLKAFIRFDRKYRCESELLSAAIQPELLLRLSADIEIPPPPVMQGITTIYGTVQHVGGKEPNAHVLTLSGASVRCVGTRSQIQQLGRQLYTLVGLEGTARINVETLEIESFTITEILPYRETPFMEALDTLRDMTQGSFDTIDALEFIRSLREDVV
jgi:hypothetical protein